MTNTDRPTSPGPQLPNVPRLDVLIDRACRHLTPDEQRAVRNGWAELDRARAERGTYRAAWHSARDRARKHRAAVDDMWDVNTRLANRARRAEKQLAAVRALHARNTNTGTCEHCSEHDYPDYAVPWLCPTIAALDDGEPADDREEASR